MIKKIKSVFGALTPFERGLWLVSVCVIIASTVLGGALGERMTENVLSGIASLIGVTALIFVARGDVLGQILTVVFAVFYGVISCALRYYGEMITYLCMTAPMAIAAVISWMKNPYRGEAQEADTPSRMEVAVGRMTKTKTVLLFLFALLVTVAFYFILGALGNASLIVSTVSVTTSFLASALTFLRSPFYALAYAANDIVLIVLWVIAAAGDISYLSMVLCFVMFFANDIYGYYNWRRMEKRQRAK